MGKGKIGSGRSGSSTIKSQNSLLLLFKRGMALVVSPVIGGENGMPERREEEEERERERE